MYRKVRLGKLPTAGVHPANAADLFKHAFCARQHFDATPYRQPSILADTAHPLPILRRKTGFSAGSDESLDIEQVLQHFGHQARSGKHDGRVGCQRQCGGAFAVESQETVVEADSAPSPQTDAELWKAFIGPNADRYLETFKKFTGPSACLNAARNACAWRCRTF